jgi:hypothetical protein
MNKKLIRLTESDLHRIVKESVNRILRENEIPNDWGEFMSEHPDYANIGIDPKWQKVRDALGTLKIELDMLFNYEGVSDENIMSAYKELYNACLPYMDTEYNPY